MTHRHSLLFSISLLLWITCGCATLSAKRVDVVCPPISKPLLADESDGDLRVYCGMLAGPERELVSHGPYAVIAVDKRGRVLPAIEDVCERGLFDAGRRVEVLHLRADGTVWRKCRWDDVGEHCFDYDEDGTGTTQRDVLIAGFHVTEVTEFDAEGRTTMTVYRRGPDELCACPGTIAVIERGVEVAATPDREEGACRGCEWMQRNAPWSLRQSIGEMSEVTLACQPVGPARIYVPIPDRSDPDNEVEYWALIAEGEMDGNLRVGTWKTFYEDGTMRGIEAHDGDTIHRTIYRPDGTKSAEGNTVAGLREGPWRFFSQGGTETWQGSYLAGQEQNEWTLSAPDGRVIERGMMVNGLRQGVWEVLEGSRTRDVEYRDGEVVPEG